MLIDLVNVVPKSDFTLELVYANGEHRLFDMKPLLAIKPWDRISNSRIFEMARAEYGTVVWPGEIDIAPETLYDDSVPVLYEQAA
jgi:Protein of unknown function (DUF2442)